MSKCTILVFSVSVRAFVELCFGCCTLRHWQCRSSHRSLSRNTNGSFRLATWMLKFTLTTGTGSAYWLGTGTSPKLKIPKIHELTRAWEPVTPPPDPKTMRIWTVHIESFIFCRHTSLNSQNIFSKKFEQVGEIPEISLIWEDGYRLLHWIADIVFIRCFGSVLEPQIVALGLCALNIFRGHE